MTQTQLLPSSVERKMLLSNWSRGRTTASSCPCVCPGRGAWATARVEKTGRSGAKSDWNDNVSVGAGGPGQETPLDTA
jgi:hypothetical protein